MECAKTFQSEEYIKLSIAASLVLQLCMYVLLPFRKQIRSKFILGFISIICSLGNLIPAFNLIIICTFAVVNHDDQCHTIEGRETAPPLLNWASLMLLHLAGHGQERETPQSLHLGEIAKESCKIILEFLFYLIIYLCAFCFLFKSWNDETIFSTIVFVLLACTRTFGKLKHLQDTHKLDNQAISTGARSLSWLNPVGACREVNDELKLVYCKFYGGAVPFLCELIIITLLAMTVSRKLAVFLMSCTYVTHHVFLYLKSRLDKDINTFFHSTALLFLLPNFKFLWETSLNISATIYVSSITISHFLLFAPIIKMYCFPQGYLIDDDKELPASWSCTIPQFNLLDYGLVRKPSKLSTAINYVLNTWSLSGNEQYSDEIGIFIFTELRNMILKLSSNDGRDSLDAAKEIIAAEGLWVLKQENYQDLIDCEATFEERVIQWHVATCILYHTQDDHNGSCFDSYLSRVLSDYMGYLLIVQPWIMSKQRGVVLKKCLEMWVQVSEFTRQRVIRGHYSSKQEFCPGRFIDEIVTKLEQDQTKTVLQDARVLAKNLETRFKDERQRWNFIVSVWVEMLAYASIRCNTMDHIRGLVQGGELSTIIWLWMLRLGFEQQR